MLESDLVPFLQVCCVILIDLSPFQASFQLRGQIYRRVATADPDLPPKRTSSRKGLQEDDAFSWTPGAALPDIKLFLYDLFDDLHYLAGTDRQLWTTRIPIDERRLQKYFNGVAESWKRNY